MIFTFLGYFFSILTPVFTLQKGPFNFILGNYSKNILLIYFIPLKCIPILMYFNDHNPPHFHVKYNDYRAIISIGELKVLDGNLPTRILGLVIE